jgi:hypothetical protein
MLDLCPCGKNLQLLFGRWRLHLGRFVRKNKFTRGGAMRVSVVSVLLLFVMSMGALPAGAEQGMAIDPATCLCMAGMPAPVAMWKSSTSPGT